MDGFHQAFPPFPTINAKEDLLLPFREGHVLVRATSSGLTLCRGWPKALGAVPEKVHFIGRIGERPCFAAELPAPRAGALAHQGPAGHAFRDLRGLHGPLSHAEYSCLVTAAEVLYWDRTYRLCPHCGAPLVHQKEQWVKQCGPCGLDIEPRAQPSVVGLLHDGMQVLLTQPPGLQAEIFTLPAAVVGPGQTLEQTLHLFLLRALSVNPGDLSYFGSQPWPYPDRLMIGLHGHVAAAALQINGDLLCGARWCHIDDLPPVPAPLSLARRMLDWYGQLPRLHGKPSVPRR